MASHPTIILIPGAYHAPSVFDLIKKKLEALSYPVTAIKLPSVNATSLTVGHKEDAEAVHEVILPLLDAGKEVTLVGHSYGGLPTYISTQGHSIAERSQAGKMGGVRSIVLVAAFAPLVAGQHLSEQNTGSDVSWVTFRAEDNMLYCNDWAKTVLYEDLPEAERELWFKKLGTMPAAPFLTPVDFPATEIRVPSLYLVTEKDRAISLEVQEKIVAGVPGMKSIRLACGHSPFLSHPDETVDAIVQGAALG